MGYNSANPGSYTSMLKFTIDGRPTIEDIHDLFSSMVSQIRFGTHKYMFRSYTCSFVSEDAIHQLTAPPSSHPDMYYSETGSHKMLKLNRDMAKALIQQFLWTRLIESVHEPHNKSYKDKGIWRLTSKGLCVFQNFLIRSKLDMSKFVGLVDASAKPMFLIQIKRLEENDRLNCENIHISSLFAIMIASLPLRQNMYNDIKEIAMGHYDVEDGYSISSSDSGSTVSSGMRGLSFSDYFPHVKILPNDALVLLNMNPLQQPQHRTTFQQQQSLLRNLSPSSTNKVKMRAMFSSMLCCSWLVDYCTIASNDEAESVMTEFLRKGWIAFYAEKYRYCNEVESSKSISLHVTKAGAKVVAGVYMDIYNQIQQQQQQSNSRQSIELYDKRYSFTSSTASMSDTILTPTIEDKMSGFGLRSKPSFHPLIQTKYLARSSPSSNNSTVPAPLFESSLQGSGSSYFDFSTTTSPTTPISENGSIKESSSLKLKAILKNDQLQQLFRDFLSDNFCVENLDFWLDYDKLLRNYNRQITNGTVNQRLILEDAYVLWDIYLRPGTLRELNINHSLREEMAEDISHMVILVRSYATGQSRSMIAANSQATAAQHLNTVLGWFDKVNDYIYKLMAFDSVPRFIRTEKYKSFVHLYEENPAQSSQKQEGPIQPLSIRTNLLSYDIDDFPPPPQRGQKEKLYV